MTDTSRVLQQLASQAAACEELGSPFTSMLCRVLAANLHTGTRFGRAILEWQGDPFPDNVALRACGAIHALARSGWEPNLTRIYPPNPTSETALWVAISDALHHNDAFLTERLASPPQTNEVARSALILGAMLHLAAITRLPLELLEFGASAGLNLAFDEYRYELGGERIWGRPGAPLTVECQWRGSVPPLGAPLSVVARSGCDLRPIDPARSEDRARLLSYIWADQRHRLERAEAALAHAARQQRRVERADAADWLESRLRLRHGSGTTRVVFHTIVTDYVPPATRARLDALLHEAGDTASRERPFAHVAIEPDQTRGSARVDLTVWPRGETVTLGRGDFHGRWAEWS